MAVERRNVKIAEILEPIEGIPGGIYARNNPKHPEFKPSAREALFQLAEMEGALAGEESPYEEEEGEENEDEDDFEEEDEEGEEGVAEKEESKQEEGSGDEVDVEFDEDNSDEGH